MYSGLFDFDVAFGLLVLPFSWDFQVLTQNLAAKNKPKTVAAKLAIRLLCPCGSEILFSHKESHNPSGDVKS